MKDRIKEARKFRKIKQDELADKIGVSRNYISLIETGDRIPPERTINDIARILSVNPEWIATGSGPMELPMDRETEIAKMVTDLYHENDSFKEELCKLIVSMTPEQIDVLKLVARKLLKENHPSD